MIAPVTVPDFSTSPLTIPNVEIKAMVFMVSKTCPSISVFSIILKTDSECS